MNEARKVDDETMDHATGRIIGALILAVFDGRPADDPSAVSFIQSMETEAGRIIDVAPDNATLLRMAARIARTAVGLSDDMH